MGNFPTIPKPAEAGCPEVGALARKLAAHGSDEPPLSIGLLSGTDPEYFGLSTEEVSDSQTGGILIIHSSALANSDHLDQIAKAAEDRQPEVILLCLPETSLVAREPRSKDLASWSFEEGQTLAERIQGYGLAHASLTLSSPAYFERHTALFVLSKTEGRFTDLGESLSTGLANLSLSKSAAEQTNPSPPPRVAIITEEINGLSRCGGIGTAYTSLAEHLAAQEQHVTIVFIGQIEDDDEETSIVATYAKKGIELILVDVAPLIEKLPWEQEYLRRSFLAYQWLSEADRDRARRFDIIHYPDCNGFGFYCAKAKEAGAAFANTSLCVGTHGSTRWANDANHIEFFSSHHLIQDHMEKVSIRLADTLIGPSQYLIHWMRNRGWELPNNVFQQPYIQPPAARNSEDSVLPPTSEPNPPQKDFTEIIFFGRLETRKGLRTFCDALDVLSPRSEIPEQTRITFLGKDSAVDGLQATEYVAARKAKAGWPWKIQLLTDLGQEDAVDYLRGAGRIAIVPSLVDNSPNTVYECIGLGIPFITGGNTGISELLHREDLSQCTFYHRDERLRGTPLADCIGRAFQEGLRPPRPAICQRKNEEIHTKWHVQETIHARSKSPDPAGTAADLSVALIYQGEDETLLQKALSKLEGSGCEDILVISGKPQEETVQNAVASSSAKILLGDNADGFGGLATMGIEAARNARCLVMRPTHQLTNTAISLLAAAKTELCMGMVDLIDTAPSNTKAPEQLSHFAIGSAPILPFVIDVQTDVPFVVSKSAFNVLGSLPNHPDEDKLNPNFFSSAKLEHALTVGIIPEIIAESIDTRPLPGSTAHYYETQQLHHSLAGCFTGPAEETFPAYLRGHEAAYQQSTQKFWAEHERANQAEAQSGASDTEGSKQIAKIRAELKTVKSAAKDSERSLKKMRSERDHLKKRLSRNLLTRLRDSLRKRMGKA